MSDDAGSMGDAFRSAANRSEEEQLAGIDAYLAHMRALGYDKIEGPIMQMAKSTVLLIKLRPEQLEKPTVMNWTVNGTVAYSKICTHLGCPAALYEQTTHHILCPCQQSTFDAARGAAVIFGPAARPLPQLPITTDSEGYLVAQSDFHEPVGPSFWERG